ncbi:MAG: insulinase family protein [Clostridiales bacterium]|jgi:predicted Zn-dependent peptidase|nr:insulinase family protein [Clostridiales bacterium]
MKLSTYKINEGINLRTIENEKFKTNSISFYLNIPLQKENVTKISLIPKVLKRGTKNLNNSTEISKFLKNMFGTSLKCGVKKKGDGEILYFHCSCIRDSIAEDNIYEKIIEFLRDIVLFPYLENNVFLKKYVEQEKENLKKNIMSIKNDKKAYAEKRCTEIMFKDEPYGIHECGFIDDLNKINETNLFDLYSKILNENTIDIFCSGSFDNEKIIELVKKNFKCLKARNAKYVKTNICFREIENKKIVKETININQSKLCIGVSCNANPKERYAFMVSDTIIGNSYHSKLFLNIREKLSLAYYVSSKIDIMKYIMIISAGIEKSKFNTVYEEINTQINITKDGNFSDKEIFYAKKHLKTMIKSVKDSQIGIESFYFSQILLGDDDDIDTFLEKILSVTREEILRCVQKLKIDTIFFLEEKNKK